MTAPQGIALDVDALQAIALDLAGERQLAPLLDRVTAGIAAQPGVALARIWLVRSDEAGKEPYQAIFDSGVSRVRPVAMAAVTTILGMVPLLADAFFESMAATDKQ